MFHKIASFLLACLLLVSTTGFSMYKHYCGDNLKEISLFDEIESCHDVKLVQEVMDDCPFHKHDTTTSLDEDSCCTEEYNRISLEDQLKQLDNNQSTSKGLSPAIFYLGFKSLAPSIPEESKNTSYLLGALINVPPLYILYTQFNFYG